MSNSPSCRFCSKPLKHILLDLGASPLANSYLTPGDLNRMEPFYPLRVYVCQHCMLVQLQEFQSPAKIFSDYAYFSSYSSSWLAHAKRYAEKTIERFALNNKSQIVEIASNDGYLLQYFAEAGIPVQGVEPAANIAKVAIEKGIPSRIGFFGIEMADNLVAEGVSADLLIGNNVYAHVPDIHSFTAGLKRLLKPGGVITLEFPHLLRLMEENQFDTIYHEHFSYFSLLAVREIFLHHDLEIFDVEQLPTHGGSLRVFGKHRGSDAHQISDNVSKLVNLETSHRLDQLDFYSDFDKKVHMVKCDLLDFLIRAKRAGKIVVGYGAPAKGNTLLNYCGVGCELLPFTVDRSSQKQGTFLPGTRIPIRTPEAIEQTRPDYVLILPWNLKDEIATQMSVVRTWGGQFVVAIPSLRVY